MHRTMSSRTTLFTMNELHWRLHARRGAVGVPQGLRFTFFDTIKAHIVASGDGAQMTSVQSFLAGGVSGAVSVVLNHPVRADNGAMQPLWG